jgi:hypothetical protein
MKDQIYFMQTETPEYKMNKQAGVAASKVLIFTPLVGRTHNSYLCIYWKGSGVDS